MNRYARQIVLPEIGHAGQQQLKKSSILFVGSGGLGSPALLYAAAAGIGRIGIVDDDTVDLSNLQRQILFTEADIGKPKALQAAIQLNALNQDVLVETHIERVSPLNIEKLVNDYDIVVDGSDNFDTKFLLGDACVKFAKPLIYGAILGFEAQVAVFGGGGEFAHLPCYRCLYPTPPTDYVPNCAQAGVMGAMAGIAGSVQALEAIKLALGLAWCDKAQLKPLISKLWLLDARNMSTHLIQINKNVHCSFCSKDPEHIILSTHSYNHATCPMTTALKTIDSATAKNLLNSATPPFLLDVREPHEVANGMIPSAHNIPLAQLLSDDASLSNLEKNTAILVYCAHGIRSQKAAAHLISLGYSNVAHLEHGFAAWPC